MTEMPYKLRFFFSFYKITNYQYKKIILQYKEMDASR